MRVVLFHLTLVVTHLLFAGIVLADGGTIRLMESRGDLQVTVFTSPAVVRVGEVDVSVLVQDKSGAIAEPDLAVEIALEPRDLPGPTMQQTATRDAATNKLLRATTFQLDRPIWWRCDVRIHLPEDRVEQFTFDMEAAPPLPRWVTLWPWFSWPAVAIALFGWHQWLTRRKR